MSDENGKVDFSLNVKKSSLTVGELFSKNSEAFEVELLSGGDNLDRNVSGTGLHYPGLALTGFYYHFHQDKIQFIADMEWHYLDSLSAVDRKACLDRFLEFKVPAVVVTAGREPHTEILESAKKHNVPIYRTKLSSNEAGKRIQQYLDDYFAPRVTMHATLVDVYGIGMLYTGKSGIGKSECALDLIERGHRLVADDIVNIVRREDALVGTGSPLLGHHMEIRGVGIINIQSLFGIRAIRLDKKVEAVVELVKWDPHMAYERLGITENTIDLLGISVDKVTVPIFPGKNITVISEIIAMNILLKYNGINTAKEFNQRLLDALELKRRQRMHE
ncbi:MAG: HPr(Ser) kinase/phosphatase [Fibrobacteres bacterium]|nr:HPr(Ser) kinase/phosphatase [Fibrobacterota bacterium]